MTRKESMQKGKKSIGPRMKYGHSNLNSNCAQTKQGGLVIKKQEHTTSNQ